MATVTIPDRDMDPDNSPGTPSPLAGIRRLNGRPLYIVLAIVVTFIVIAIVIALGRGAGKPGGAADDAEANRKSVSDAQAATDAVLKEQRGQAFVEAKPRPLQPAGVGPLGVPVSGSTTLAGPVPPSGAVPGSVQGAVPIVTPNGVDLPPPTPPGGANYNAGNPSQPRQMSPAQSAAMKRREARFALFEAAVAAKPSVSQIAARGAGSPPSPAVEGGTNLDPLRAQLDAARGQADAAASAAQGQVADLERAVAAAGGEGGSGVGAGGAGGAGQPSYASFDNRGGNDRWRSVQAVQPPRSPFELRAGFVIPATLIAGVNSDIPGTIIAQVSQNVYDTATGRFMLIPQGSRLVGTYGSNAAYGQKRVLVAWQRIVFPDGKALDLGSMPGADAAGYAGFKDKVNTHFLRVISQALLLSGVTAGVSLSQPQQTVSADGQLTAGSALSQALGQQLGQVTAQIIAKNLNVSPTLVIRPGFRFNVVVVKDLTFTKPYRNFDY